MKTLSLLLASLSPVFAYVGIVSPTSQVVSGTAGPNVLNTGTGQVNLNADGTVTFVMGGTGALPSSVTFSMGMASVLQADSNPQCASLSAACSPFTNFDLTGAAAQQSVLTNQYSFTLGPQAARNGQLFAGGTLEVWLYYTDISGAFLVFDHYHFATLPFVAPTALIGGGISDITPGNPLGTDAIVKRPGRLSMTVRTERGGEVEVPRGDLLDIGQFSYAYDLMGSTTRYRYSLDTTKGAALIRIGDRPAKHGDAYRLGIVSHAEPPGWDGTNGSWQAIEHPKYSANTQFTAESTWVPGLLPIFIQNDWMGITAAFNGDTIKFRALPNLGSRDNLLLHRAASINSNSLRRYAIGPVFRPGVSQADVLDEVAIWAKDYGFSFLAPLVGTKDPKEALMLLQPSNDLERDIVACLERVIQ